MNWFTYVLSALWGLYAWCLFGLAVLFSLLVCLVVPGLPRRQRLISAAARLVFRGAGVPVSVNGIANLPEGDCVVVANHASYIDGVLLKGYLPPRFNYVIKGEMRNIPIVHFLLRRSGAKFVERNEHARSSRDARQIVKAAVVGESLGVFPEGTFIKKPGVGRFRAGAFVAAVRGNLPVVPVAILGSRDVLRSGSLLPRRYPLTVEILPAISPGDAEYANSRALAETSRQRILAVLDEPDLLAENGAPAGG